MRNMDEYEKLRSEQINSLLVKVAKRLIDKSLKSKVRVTIIKRSHFADQSVEATFYDENSNNFFIPLYDFDSKEKILDKEKQICDIMESEKLFIEKLGYERDEIQS